MIDLEIGARFFFFPPSSIHRMWRCWLLKLAPDARMHTRIDCGAATFHVFGQAGAQERRSMESDDVADAARDAASIDGDGESMADDEAGASVVMLGGGDDEQKDQQQSSRSGQPQGRPRQALLSSFFPKATTVNLTVIGSIGGAATIGSIGGSRATTSVACARGHGSQASASASSSSTQPSASLSSSASSGACARCALMCCPSRRPPQTTNRGD